MALLDEWTAWREDSVPFVLEADREVLCSSKAARCVETTTTSWPAAYGADDFGAPEDTRLHLGLLPGPFCGDLRRASIYILLLNPGLGPHDYYGQYQVPEFRKTVLNNLKQRFSSATLPFYMLHPQFSWHGGFRWWHGKLEGVIGKLRDAWKVSFAAARARLAHQLASIELIPYHSASFRDGGGWIRDLHSVNLARSFVTVSVLPRVESGEVIVIVTRKAKAWNLPNRLGVIQYSGTEARSAHLTPESRGRQAILEHFLRGS